MATAAVGQTRSSLAWFLLCEVMTYLISLPSHIGQQCLEPVSGALMPRFFLFFYRDLIFNFISCCTVITFCLTFELFKGIYFFMIVLLFWVLLLIPLHSCSYCITSLYNHEHEQSMNWVKCAIAGWSVYLQITKYH